MPDSPDPSVSQKADGRSERSLLEGYVQQVSSTCEGIDTKLTELLASGIVPNSRQVSQRRWWRSRWWSNEPDQSASQTSANRATRSLTPCEGLTSEELLAILTKLTTDILEVKDTCAKIPGIETRLKMMQERETRVPEKSSEGVWTTRESPGRSWRTFRQRNGNTPDFRLLLFRIADLVQATIVYLHDTDGSEEPRFATYARSKACQSSLDAVHSLMDTVSNELESHQEQIGDLCGVQWDAAGVAFEGDDSRPGSA